MQVGSQYLFPLSKIDKRLSSYYVSAEGKMFSTRRSSVGRVMVGSGSYVGMRYFTMNGQSYDGAVLYRRAQQHADWKAETSKPTASILSVSKHDASQPKVTGRSHAQAVDQGIKGRGFVIAQVAVHDGQEHLLFGSKPAIHMTEQSYKDEMTRLASAKPGTKFVALKIVASVISGGVQWE